MRPVRSFLLAAAMLIVLALVVAPFSQADTASSFKTKCSYIKSEQIDPMTQPGVPVSAHLHNFYNNTQVNKDSTGTTLRAAGSAIHTSCALGTDTASIWDPALRVNNQYLQPKNAISYYVRIVGLTNSAGAPIDSVTLPYVDMNLLAGNKFATAPQPQSVVKFQCVDSTNIGAYPPNCAGHGGLSIQSVFPSCWTGQQRTPGQLVDDVLPVSIINNVKKCPAGHDVQIPQVRLGVQYPNVTQRDCRVAGTGPCSTYTLSTNPTDPNSIYQYHANEMIGGWAIDGNGGNLTGFGLDSLILQCNNPGTPAGCGDLSTTPPGDAYVG